MLVLTRKPSQQITITGGVTLTVVTIRGGSVRIGIEAPPDVKVARTELLQKLEASGVRRQEIEVAA